MILFKRAGDLSGWLKGQRSRGKTIGFIPTMGALHAGHISLIDISKKSAGVTVCSIFVNPTQFNDPKDFQKYPITIEKDIYLLEKAGTDVLFLPEVGELYPGGQPPWRNMSWEGWRLYWRGSTGRGISRGSARSCGVCWTSLNLTICIWVKRITSNVWSSGSCWS